MSFAPFGLKLLRNSGVATLARIFGRGLGYLAQVVLARLLIPDDFGLFAIGWTIFRLFSIAGHLGLDYGVINFGSRTWHKDDKRFKSFTLLSLGGAVFSGLVFGSLLYLLAPWLSDEFFKKPDLLPILKGFAILFPLVTALRILAATSSISRKMLCGGIAEDIAQPLLQIILFLVFVHNGMDGISAIILAIFISYVIAIAIGFVCVIRLVPDAIGIGKIYLKDFFSLISYSIPAIIAVTFAAFNLWGDRLIMGYFGTQEQTGIFQSISIITMMTTIILSGIKITISPVISQAYHAGETEKLHSIGKMIIRWTLYFSIPFVLVTAIAPREIISIAFGAAYQSGSTALFWLIIGQFFYITFGLGDQFFLMTGRIKDWLIIATIIFSLTVTLDAIMIPLAGLVGAALVSCGMMLLMGFLSLIRLKRIHHFWLIDRHHIKIWLAAISAGLITSGILYFLILSPLPKVLTAFFISLICFVIFLYLYGMNHEDRNIISLIMKIPLKTDKENNHL